VEAVFGSEVAAAALKRMGPPATIDLARDLVSEAAGRAPTALLVKIRDSAGNLTEATPELTSDVGEVGAPVRLERGVYRVLVLTPPEAPRRAVVVTARADRAVGSLSIAPSAAAVIRVTPHAPIQVDGSAAGQFEILEVAVVDGRGQPAGETPVGSGGRGEFRAAFPVSPGHWALPYRPPPIAENTTERVLVTAGAASTAVDLELRARRISFSLGLGAGAAVAGELGPAGEAEAGVWTLVGGAQLGLVLDAGWRTRSTTGTASVGGVDTAYRATQRYLPVLLSLAWRKPLARRWMIQAALGAGGSLVSSRSQVSGQPAVSERGLAPAAGGSLSAGLLLGPGALFLEARSTWIGDAKLSTVSGTSLNVLALLGYRFDVG
jgi:hypothetical protein